MSKHTPGPWIIGEPSGTTIHVNMPLGGEDSWQIIAVARDFYDGIHTVEQIEEIRKANARLIAAAPEMLEELKNLVELFEVVDMTDEAILEAKALIARIEETQAP